MGAACSRSTLSFPATFRPQVCSFFGSHLDADGVHVSIVLDLDLCRSLMLDVDAEKVRQAVLNAPKLKLKEMHVRAVDKRTIRVYPSVEDRQAMLHNVQASW